MAPPECSAWRSARPAGAWEGFLPAARPHRQRRAAPPGDQRHTAVLESRDETELPAGDLDAAAERGIDLGVLVDHPADGTDADARPARHVGDRRLGGVGLLSFGLGPGHRWRSPLARRRNVFPASVKHFIVLPVPRKYRGRLSIVSAIVAAGDHRRGIVTGQMMRREAGRAP